MITVLFAPPKCFDYILLAARIHGAKNEELIPLVEEENNGVALKKAAAAAYLRIPIKTW